MIIKDTKQLPLFDTSKYFNLVQENQLKRGNPNFKRNYSDKTKVIRVPVYLADQIKQIAIKLDRGENIVTEDNKVDPKRPKSLGLRELDPKEIKIDPARFQFKIVHSKTGSTGSLSGVSSWDDNLAGLLLCWLDPIDGHIYIVNGHNRLSLANKLNVDLVACKLIDAKDAKEARLIGALANIAEGHGTAIDCAKVFRESNLTAKDLKDRGLKLKDSLAETGLHLSKLQAYLWDKVLTGNLDPSVGSAIGSLDSDQAQNELYKLIQKEKRSLTQSVLQELTAIVKSSYSESSLFNLFGDYQESNAVEKAELISYINSRLKTEKILFSKVSKNKNAKLLERGNNKIDTLESKCIAESSQSVYDLFNQLKYQSGPLAEKLDYFATQIKTCENKTETLDRVYNHIFMFLNQDNLLELMG